MQNEQEIEVRIWEYLDGLLTETEEKEIALMIAEDPLWRKKHEEILGFQQLLTGGLELQEPPLRFSKNVMDALEKEKIAPAAGTYLNKWIIRGIAAFFLIMIGSFLWDAFSNLSAGEESRINMPLPDLSGLKMPDLSGSAFMYGFTLSAVVAALILVDLLIRKKRSSASEA